jgi:hypothetical protein
MDTTHIECNVKSTSKLEKYLGRIGMALGGFHDNGLGYNDIYHINNSTVETTDYHGHNVTIDVVGKDRKTVAQRIANWIRRYEKPTVLKIEEC